MALTQKSRVHKKFGGMSALLILPFLFLAAQHPAQSAPDDIGTVEVRADKKSGVSADSPVSVSQIRTQRSDAGKSAAEIAARAPGVRIRQSASGDEIMVRGAASNQTPVYVDGILQNNLSLRMLRSDEIERVDIYRGYTPGAFSTPGIGGAVNLITKKNRGASTEAGHTITGTGYESFVRDSRTGGALANSFSLYQYYDKGNFSYTNDNGTPAMNSGDDYTERRRNNATARISGGDTVSHNGTNHRLWFSLQALSQLRGVPGIGTLQARHTRKSMSVAGADGGIEYYSDSFSVKSRGMYRNESTVTADPEREILSVNYDRRTLTTISTQNNIIVRFGELESTLYLSCDNETYHKDEQLESDESSYPRQMRTLWGGALDLSYNLFSQRVQLIAQARTSYSRQNFYDEYRWYTTGKRDRKDSDYAAFGGHGALLVHLISRTLNLKCGGGRSYRLADPSEIFGSAGYVQGNTSLRPEYVDRGEGGFEITAQGGDLSFTANAVAFYSKAKDVILYIQNSQKTLKAWNISQAQIIGAEGGTDLTVLRHFGLGANYTWQDARDRGEIDYYRGKILPHRPPHEMLAFVKIFTDSSELRYTADFVSFYFLDRANTQANYQRSSLTHSLDASSVIGGFSLAASCRNFTDVRKRDAVGYPLAGRSYMLSAQVKY